MSKRKKNPSITFVTSFNLQGYTHYGRRMIEAFKRYVDPNINLIVFCENVVPEIQADNIIYKNLLADQELMHFINHSVHNIPKDRVEYVNKRIKQQKISGYIFDAKRFCYKIFAYTNPDVIKNNNGYLVWCDADSVFQQYMSCDDFLDYFDNPPATLKNYVMAYLGRVKWYCEGGFVVYPVFHKDTKQFLHDLRDFYVSGDIFQDNDGWHDSHIIDVLRRRYEKNKKRCWNITENLIGKNIWYRSWFANYCRHDIGNAKWQKQKQRKNKDTYWRDIVNYMRPKTIVTLGSNDIDATVIISQWAYQHHDKITHHIMDYFNNTSSYNIDGNLRCLYTQEFFTQAINDQLISNRDKLDIILHQINDDIDQFHHSISVVIPKCDLLVINQNFDTHTMQKIFEKYKNTVKMIAFNGVVYGTEQGIHDYIKGQDVLSIPQSLAQQNQARFLPMPLSEQFPAVATIGLLGQQQNHIAIS